MDLLNEGLIKAVDKDKGVFIIDSRTFNISGLTGNNQNFNFGDHGKIEQKVNELGEAELDKLFKDLSQYASANSDDRDVKAIEAIKENAKSGKMDTAKTLFEFLTKTVQASSAGVAIAKAFGWI